MKKLTITSDSLKPALAKLSQAVNIKNSLTALVNVYCKVTPNQLELIGTDTEITICYRLECEAKESFDFLLPFEFLNKIIAINKGYTLEIEAGKVVKIKCNSDVYEVKPNSKISEFPQLQAFPFDNIFTIDSTLLHSLITALNTTGNIREFMTFVCLDIAPNKATVVSTDANVLFSQEFETTENLTQQLLLSAKALKALNGSTEIKASYNDKIIGFDNGLMQVIIVRTTTSKYPDYKSIFPADWDANFYINRYAFIDVLSKASLSSDPFKNTTLHFTNKEILRLTAKDDMLDIDLTVEAKNDVANIEHTSINSEKMLKLLHQIEVNDIELAIHNAQRAIVITSKELNGYKALIMPLQIAN